MAYKVISSKIGVPALTETHSTKPNSVELGEIVVARDSALFDAEFMFVQASNSVAQYDAVAIKHGYKIGQLTITSAKTAIEIGFAQVANGTKDTYMFVQKSGRPIVKLALATQANAPLYASSTGGVLTSASTSAMIQGVVAVTEATNSANPKTCVARYPTADIEPAA